MRERADFNDMFFRNPKWLQLNATPTGDQTRLIIGYSAHASELSGNDGQRGICRQSVDVDKVVKGIWEHY